MPVRAASSSGEHAAQGFLGFVEDEDRAQQGTSDVLGPAGAQGLEAAPAVVDLQGHTEEVAEIGWPGSVLGCRRSGSAQAMAAGSAQLVANYWTDVSVAADTAAQNWREGSGAQAGAQPQHRESLS